MKIHKFFLEADDDENAAGGDTANNPGGNEADEANNDANAGDDEVDNSAAEDVADDFDMDGDLGGDDEGGGDDTGGGDSGSGGFDGGADGEEEPTDDEVKQQNADMFTSLSAEEQKIKIVELKKLYLELYTNCDDILNRIDEFPVDEDTIDIISRVSSAMYRIKKEMEDYLQLKFPNATYYEYDVAYNRFLYFYNSVAEIIEDTAKFREKLVGKDKENEDK